MKLSDIVGGVWAITPKMYSEIQRIYGIHMGGDKIDLKKFEAQTGLKLNNERKYMQIMDSGHAIISLNGIMSKRANILMNISGGVSTQIAMDEFKSALNNPEIHTIIMSVDSPGGTADGEFPELIKSARGIKPVIALVDGQAASQAYWTISGADKIYINSQTAITGSIGVIMKHIDKSKILEAGGVKITEILAGKYKSMAPEHKPLSEAGEAYLQDKVDYFYSLFVDTVAANRGIDAMNHEVWANGDFFIGEQAIEVGLVDGIKTLDAIMEETGGGDPSLSDNANGVSQVVAVKDISKGQVVMASDIKDVEAVAGDVTEPDEVKGQETMTRDKLKAEFPEVYQAIHDDAFKAGVDSVDTDAMKRDGAKAETQRIADVRATLIPGFEAQIDAMVADGETTGDQAAGRLIKAQQDALKDKGADVSKDAADLIQASAEPQAPGTEAIAALEAEWSKMDADAQAGYGSKEAFVAYEKNIHRARTRTSPTGGDDNA